MVRGCAALTPAVAADAIEPAMNRATPAPPAPSLYQAFGLIVRSRWALPELPLAAAEATADIEIECGEVPVNLPDASVRNAFFDVAGNEMLIRIGGVARYLLRAGSAVVVAPEDGASEDEVRAFLLTVVFGALLHQRDELVLHGSAVAIGGRAVAFLGFSGLGKSTLAAGFRRRGYPVLTDDLCVVRRLGEAWSVPPSFPHMKLWLDALERLELSAEGLRRIRHKEEKRALPLHDKFAAAPLPLTKIYVLRRAERHERPEVLPLAGPAKFAALRNQTYRRGMLEGLAKKTRSFQQALAVARDVPVSLLVRPAQGFHLDELIRLVEADLGRGGE